MSDMSPIERRKKVKQMRESGMTFTQIGIQMGVSRSRAMDLYKSAVRISRMENNKPDLYRRLEEAAENDFSDMFQANVIVRAYNALLRNGIRTIEELKAVSPEDIMRLRNVGKKTFQLIMNVRNREV